MTFYFLDPRRVEKFMAFCKKRNVHGKIKTVDDVKVAELPESQFRTKTERAKFVAAWADANLEVIDEKPRRARSRDDEPEFEVLT